MLSPLPRHSDWRYCFAHFAPVVSAFPDNPVRSAHASSFSRLLGVHSRYGLHTRAVTVYRDTLSEGFSHFVTSIAAPVASGWSGCRVGTYTPLESAALSRRTGRADIGALICGKRY